MKPELEIVLGEKRWINTVVAKDIKVGEDFDLFCNVTMDVGHVAQTNWLRNVRRYAPKFLTFLPRFFFQSEPLQSQSVDKVGHKNNNTSKYYFNKLSFDNVTMEDSGEYTCIVINHVGQQNNETIEVNVIEGGSSEWRFERTFPHQILYIIADEICSLKHVQDTVEGVGTLHVENCFPITATAGDQEVSFSMATKPRKEILWWAEF